MGKDIVLIPPLKEGLEKQKNNKTKTNIANSE
jgi:hypothetical protein